MSKQKIDELDKSSVDINSPETQEFLRNLQKEIRVINEDIKKWMKSIGILEKYENYRNNKSR